VSEPDDRRFEEMLARISFRLGREARWSYFQDGAGPMFIWNTERLHMKNETDPGHGMFESGVAVPYGPGSRSNKATNWKILSESRCFHSLRKDAKTRALRLYVHWQRTGKVEV
jgi:hypothetical protein